MRNLLLGLILCLVGLPAFAGTCTVTELVSVWIDANGRVIQIATFSGASQPTSQLVTFTTATAITNAFQPSTRYLRINCDIAANFQLGTAPATGLTSADPRIGAGATEYIAVVPSEVQLSTLKIAFYDGSS